MAITGKKPKDVEQTHLKGRVDAAIWRSPEGDAAILRVKEEGNGNQSVSAKGPVGHVQVGENIEVTGRWKSHQKWGWGFQVVDVKVTQPLGRVGLVLYLQNNVPGVGPSFAEKIADKWGEKALDVLDADPRKLLEIKGISKKKIEEVVDTWEEKKNVRDVMLFLNTHGVKANKASRLLKAYGDDTIKLLKENPYRITELPTIGFVTADDIAVSIGFPLDSIERVDAGIQWLLYKAGDNGHVFLHISELLRKAQKDLDIANIEVVKERLEVLNTDGSVVIDKRDYKKPRVYVKSMYDLENNVARQVRHLVKSESFLKTINPHDYVEQRKTELTQEQWSAIENVFNHRISVLTGNPGVGKTFSVATLLNVLDEANITYELAAPTGKASKRLSELTGKPAKTIHRLLKWSFHTHEFMYNETEPLTSQVVIVDETSMVDLPLAHSLLSAMGDKQHIMFIGDKDQLPSVSAGKFLDDLLASETIPTTVLTKIFRQAARSMIIQNSRRINRGKFPYTQDSDLEGFKNNEIIKDFFLVPRKENAAIVKTTVDFVMNRIPKWKQYDPIKDIQVYAPMTKGDVGLNVLNATLQKRLNPKGKPIGYKNFRVGDKIMQTKNNYDLDLMNGESGIIVSADQEKATIHLETADGLNENIPYDELWSFILAYAISIHRSQGSQAKAVVIPMTTSHFVMLKRNLLYTAVTRAEELCVLVGQARAVAIAVRTVDTEKRNSGLAERIRHGADEVTSSADEASVSAEPIESNELAAEPTKVDDTKQSRKR